MESGHSKRSLPVSVVFTNREIVSTSTVYSLPFPFFLSTKYSFLNNLVRFFLGQNNDWLFCEYLLSSSSFLLANVSVLSKLVKFLHHINPTRQYPACVLSTHIENATFAGKPARSYIFFIYSRILFIAYFTPRWHKINSKLNAKKEFPLYQRCQPASLYLYWQTSLRT